jgi:hypothetical protein
MGFVSSPTFSVRAVVADATVLPRETDACGCAESGAVPTGAHSPATDVVDI